ncbi:MAG: undecaprenyldiphospho-muramoylpentapeptide beta-N-acetylglucosaminyltransferase, partial [Nitrosomonadaceae bacterium]
MSHTILIMAGGTGGHVFPALAVADYMKVSGWRVVWLGTKGGMESMLVSQKGYDIETIDFSGLRGKNFITWLTLPLRLLLAFWQSAKVLFQIRPDVVLGMGGYPAFPGGIMASLLNKSLLIHEQNSIPGLANKILARFADKVLLGFPDAIRNEKKVVFSGNPVRNEISQLDTPDKRYAGRSGKFKLLIIGGSLGSQALNTIVPQTLKLIPDNMRPLVTHQAGRKHLETLKKNYAKAGVEGELVVFIEDMAVHYADCDLVICRAGALTIAELTAVGTASILVPFPYAVDDHQTSNAKFLS